MIPPATVQQILDTAQVEEVIEEFVTLRRRGANLLGLCPFHNEKTPSFTVSPAKNLYKCFGCGRGGSAVGFLMEHEHLSYPEALRYLAKKYNIEIEEVEKDDEQIKEEQQRQSLMLINEYAQKYFSEQLTDTDEGRAIGLSYFKHRGLLESTIKKFDLGYAPKGGKVFQQSATAKGYNEDSLKQLGLVTQSGYDFYRERVVFPFHSISGKVIGFGARQLSDNKKSPKYLNSPESNIYNKRKTLYGLFQAKGEIRKKNTCILVEGYTDVLSLYQNGIQNVVASSGTSLTHEQARLVKRFAADAIVLYDGDAAGQNAAMRGLDIFLDADVNVKLVMLPEGHDPDSYMREVGATAFEEYLQNSAQDFILMRAKTIRQTTEGDPVNKSIQIKELIVSIAKIKDQMKRSLYIRECADILDVSEASIIKESNKAISVAINKRKKEESRKPAVEQPPTEYYNKEIPEDHSQGIHIQVVQEEWQEREIVSVLLQSGDKIYDNDLDITIAESIISRISGCIELINNDTYKSIITTYANWISNEEKDWDVKKFTESDNPKVREIATDLLIQKHHIANFEEKGYELQTQKKFGENHVKECDDSVYRFLDVKLKNRIKELKAMIDSNNNPEYVEVLLTAWRDLQNERKELYKTIGKTVIS